MISHGLTLRELSKLAPQMKMPKPVAHTAGNQQSWCLLYRRVACGHRKPMEESAPTWPRGKASLSIGIRTCNMLPLPYYIHPNT